jgi:hypothetical protein
VSFTDEEKKRFIELGRQIGIEVSFGNKEPGIFIGENKVSDLKDVFPELREL